MPLEDVRSLFGVIVLGGIFGGHGLGPDLGGMFEGMVSLLHVASSFVF